LYSSEMVDQYKPELAIIAVMIYRAQSQYCNSKL
jgi:hypothetical protein